MKVLVLCTGNINRSQFCALLIRTARPDWEVRSAGLKTKDGRLTTPKARRAAEARGLSLEGVRSTAVTLDMVRWADLVLYMDGGNEKRVHRLIDDGATNERDRALLLHRCQLLARYGCLRRLGDPNYTSDPEVLYEMWAAQELCVGKFLEKHQ